MHCFGPHFFCVARVLLHVLPPVMALRHGRPWQGLVCFFFLHTAINSRKLMPYTVSFFCLVSWIYMYILLLLPQVGDGHAASSESKTAGGAERRRRFAVELRKILESGGDAASGGIKGGRTGLLEVAAGAVAGLSRACSGEMQVLCACSTSGGWGSGWGGGGLPYAGIASGFSF